MKDEIVDFLKNKVVQCVTHENEDTILIKFENTDKCLKLYADADCCSESWFETLKQEFDFLVGKMIKNIEETTTYVEMEPSDRQECDQNQVIQIQFQDSEDIFEMVLRNSSNGYYSGWLHISLV